MIKKEFFSKEILKQLGLKGCEPVWATVYKLRKAMGNRDALYTLKGLIERDKGFFTIESFDIEKQRDKRGRGNS